MTITKPKSKNGESNTQVSAETSETLAAFGVVVFLLGYLLQLVGRDGYEGFYTSAGHFFIAAVVFMVIEWAVDSFKKK